MCAVRMPPMKKQMAEIQLETASCRVPLIPCPLVHPSAQRAPKPMQTPPTSATMTRSNGLPPNAAAQMRRNPLPVKITGQQRRNQRSDDNAHHQHPLPVHDKPYLLVVGFQINLFPRKQFFNHAAGLGKACRTGDRFSGDEKAEPAQDADADPNCIRRPAHFC